MDMQMPEMDGLETTARFRKQESGAGRRTPIIAMTANAGENAREQCLEGGMDHFVAKPIQDRELFEAICAIVPTVASSTAPRESIAAYAVPLAATINQAQILASVGGSVPMLRQLIADFRLDVGPLMDELTEGLDKNDCKAVHRAAHTLKGMVSFFGVSSVTRLALYFEEMGTSGKLPQTPEKLAGFRREVARLQADLDII
jgi:CheY-like chemotaxis protein